MIGVSRSIPRIDQFKGWRDSSLHRPNAGASARAAPRGSDDLDVAVGDRAEASGERLLVDEEDVPVGAGDPEVERGGRGVAGDREVRAEAGELAGLGRGEQVLDRPRLELGDPCAELLDPADGSVVDTTEVTGRLASHPLVVSDTTVVAIGTETDDDNLLSTLIAVEVDGDELTPSWTYPLYLADAGEDEDHTSQRGVEVATTDGEGISNLLVDNLWFASGPTAATGGTAEGTTGGAPVALTGKERGSTVTPAGKGEPVSAGLNGTRYD